jgi:nucleoside-triphosphatase THEP1
MIIQAYLITGESGVGKTPALKSIVEGLGREHCGGFYPSAFSLAREKQGYRVKTLGG